MIPLKQRNHTLFGSVWSSMRRHGPSTFRHKGGNGHKTNNHHHNNHHNDMSDYQMSSLSSSHHQSGGGGGGDYLSRGLSDGMNHITKNMMQFKSIGSDGNINNGGGLTDRSGIIGSGLHMSNENIPMRPLIMNGVGSDAGAGAKNFQNFE